MDDIDFYAGAIGGILIAWWLGTLSAAVGCGCLLVWSLGKALYQKSRKED